MTEQSSLTWKFSREFWMANLMELFERAAYYGFFIIITLYLNDVVGFNDWWSQIVAMTFAAVLYFLPPFSGAVADRIGFKNGLILAFGLLTIGYFFLGVFLSKASVILFLIVVLVGASFIKPLITGTVAKTTSQANRARGFALFYWVVNIGAFSGKTFVPYIRQEIGLEYVSFFSSAMSLLALLAALFLFRDIDEKKQDGKTLAEVFSALLKILSHPRLMALTVITSGFWLIQSQLYATMPKFVIRMVGDAAKPEWLANVNPLIVVIFVVMITHLMRRFKPETSIFIGMLLMPVSAFAMSLGPWLQGKAGVDISILGLVILHPFTVMMIVGIIFQALAECFISPRYLEYFSLFAPKGEEGIYLGFSHLHSFISYIFSGILSGYLLTKYCPDPKTLPDLVSTATDPRYAQAHIIWYFFAGIGVLSALALWIFIIITGKKDRQINAAV